MLELTGKYTSAKIFTDNVEKEALSQIYDVLNHPAFKGEVIRIMPDCHAGKGCTIGFTSTYTNKIIPNLVGVDLGCGMLAIDLGRIDINLPKLDSFIRSNVPYGQGVNKQSKLPLQMKALIDVTCSDIETTRQEYYYNSIGSLGSGNHFIELNVDKNNHKWLVIHSGSRNFGYKVAQYYQKMAEETCEDVGIKRELSYLEGIHKNNYLASADIATQYAKLNREQIATKILDYLSTKLSVCSHFHTVHNYIDTKNKIIRKGAVSADSGELLVIPINMRDGSILARGKGNRDWNNSAPHGAGRVLSRSKAKEEISVDDYIETMKGIYTTSVSKDTVDEAPFAYKSIDEILNNIGDTVDIVDILKPMYNFKAS